MSENYKLSPIQKRIWCINRTLVKISIHSAYIYVIVLKGKKGHISKLLTVSIGLISVFQNQTNEIKRKYISLANAIFYK